MKKKTAIIIGSLIALGLIIGFVAVNSRDAPIQDPELGGWSIVVRDVIGVYGTPTASTTDPVTLSANLNYSGTATSTATTTLFQNTDAVLVTITQPTASTTNSFTWHIVGSNDWEACNAIGTTTEDDSYTAAYPLIVDINWYPLIAADVTASGLDNSGRIDVASTGYTADVNASSTSFLLTDMNWTCLKTEYKGASTTVLMQIREKVLTIQ